MTGQNIAIQRLYSQQLEHTTCKSPSEIVAQLGAMQAQDYAGAKWSIGLRLPGSTDADIEQAIIDKTVVRTWVMRGTLQFVSAADLRWMVALVAPRIIASSASRYKELELDEETFAQSNRLFEAALQGGSQLTRSELFAVLQANGISTQGQRGVHLLSRASLDSLICQGVMRNNDPSFMLIDESFAQARAMTRDEALAELSRRYFTTRAPATLQDFVWWSGLLMPDARAGIDAIRSEFSCETINGKTYWFPQAMPALPEDAPSVHLLPGFDEYLISYRDRTASLAPEHARAVVPGGNGVFMPTIVIDGRVVGLWKRTFRKGAVVIEFKPFDALTDLEHQAATLAAQPYSAFLQMPTVFSL